MDDSAVWVLSIYAELVLGWICASLLLFLFCINTYTHIYAHTKSLVQMDFFFTFNISLLLRYLPA